MKVLIISLPRTGSSSFQSNICKERNLISIFEPWDGSNRFSYETRIKNCCVKTILFQSPINFYLDFYRSISNDFDEVFLLSRRDLIACAESWAYLVYNNHKEGHNSLKSYIWDTPPDVDKHYNDIIRWDREIKSLGKDLDIPITYYEDIFDAQSVERYRKDTIEYKNLI